MAQYAIISDIHANLEALIEVLAKIRSLGIDEKNIFCLGDVIGYGPNPVEVMEMMRALDNGNGPAVWIRGNHEEMIKVKRENPLQYAFYAHGISTRATKAIEWTIEQFQQANGGNGQLDFISGLPSFHKLTLDGLHYYLVHGCPSDDESVRIDTYVGLQEFGSDGRGIGIDIYARSALGYMARNKIDVVFLGHLHIPFSIYAVKRGITEPYIDVFSNKQVALERDTRYIFNVGSVGQPRDKNPMASFAVLDTCSNQVTNYRVSYDVAATRNKILAIGALDNSLGERLLRGD